MNCDQDLVLAFIEEDNIQRAYFRVRPLLTIHGDVQEEALRLWPDHGCLRIVPDRNEQHTFKDRMRSLGSFCVMNLVGIPSDANKIRTNKNYKPERGECNQFILYSDTVHSLPEHTFFEVLSGAAGDFSALAEKAITPLFYIHENDTIYGPVKKAAPELPAPAAEAAGTLYPLACPDGVQRTILCMETPAEALPQPPAAPEAPKKIESAPKEDEALPIGEALHILDERKDFQETLDAIAQPLSAGANLLREQPKKAPAPRELRQPAPGKLSGTPLFQANLRTSTPQPKNKLQEVVASQLRVGRYEPPTDALPAGVQMQPIENPVEQACQQLRRAWQIPDSRAQLVDFLLSLDGMRARLDSLSDTSGTTPLQRVLHQRLEDLEADRLRALVHLDKAKADLEAFRKETIGSLSARTRAEIDELTAQKEALEAALSALKNQQAALATQRDELLARVDEIKQNALPEALAKAMADAALTAPVYGVPLRMSPRSGKEATLDEMVGRITEAYAACGLEICRNECIALLLLLAICPRLGVKAKSMAAASTMLGNVVRSLGWESGYAVQVSGEQKPVAAVKPPHAAHCLCLSTVDCHAPLAGVKRLYMTASMARQTESYAYAMDPWPVYPMNTSAFVPQPAISGEPVSEEALMALLDKACVKDEEIDAVLGGILRSIDPLSAKADREMRHFIASAAALMDGGLPAACDWALLLWMVPLAGSAKEKIAALLDEYPLARAAL